MKDLENLFIEVKKGVEFGYTYGHNSPTHPFEFFIYNKNNNKVRARVYLDETELKRLRMAINEHLGEAE